MSRAPTPPTAEVAELPGSSRQWCSMIVLNVAGVELPPTLGTVEAASLLGVSTDCLYESVRAGTAPVEPLRLGSRLRWPTARLLAVLGIAPPDEVDS